MVQNRYRKIVVKNKEQLRDRVVRMITARSLNAKEEAQCSFNFGVSITREEPRIETPSLSLPVFLEFLCDAVPTGDLFLFGGILREVAMYGRRGFDSDIDIVVDGEWEAVVKYLIRRGAKRNRFGGLRCIVDGWPVDIWRARDTWAIREGHVEFRGIESLLKTTILNWDAILLNWRAKEIICDRFYLRDIHEGIMKIVLERNPDPLGASVRAFRHLCLKDARKISIGAARFLSQAAKTYPFDVVQSTERNRFHSAAITLDVLEFFEKMDTKTEDSIRKYCAESPRPIQPRLI